MENIAKRGGKENFGAKREGGPDEEIARTQNFNWIALREVALFLLLWDTSSGFEMKKEKI